MCLILLVDDDADMLKLTERWIVKAGHDTMCATSGEEALGILKAAKPDVIVLDYAMPQMDSPAVFRAIKADESTRSIPVIFRTGIEDGESEAVLKELSPEGVISKSEGKPGLLGIINNVMQ